MITANDFMTRPSYCQWKEKASVECLSLVVNSASSCPLTEVARQGRGQSD